VFTPERKRKASIRENRQEILSCNFCVATISMTCLASSGGPHLTRVVKHLLTVQRAAVKLIQTSRQRLSQGLID
jgi:hypothetical protein